MECRGSILQVQAGLQYDVQMIIDAQPIGGTVITKSNKLPVSAGNAHYVSDDGNDANPGTTLLPLRNVNTAIQRMNGGDILYVKGRHYLGGTMPQPPSGAPASWTVIASWPGHEAIIDATWEDYSKGIGVWTNHPEHHQAIWSAPVRTSVGRPPVAQGEFLLYPYASIAELINPTPGVAGGCFSDQGNSRVYVRLPDDGDPNGREININRVREPWRWTGGAYIRVTNIKFRFGIEYTRLYDCINTWWDHNAFVNCTSAIRGIFSTGDLTFENNDVYKSVDYST